MAPSTLAAASFPPPLVPATFIYGGIAVALVAIVLGGARGRSRIWQIDLPQVEPAAAKKLFGAGLALLAFGLVWVVGPSLLHGLVGGSNPSGRTLPGGPTPGSTPSAPTATTVSSRTPPATGLFTSPHDGDVLDRDAAQPYGRFIITGHLAARPAAGHRLWVFLEAGDEGKYYPGEPDLKLSKGGKWTETVYVIGNRTPGDRFHLWLLDLGRAGQQQVLAYLRHEQQDPNHQAIGITRQNFQPDVRFLGSIAVTGK